MHIHFQIVDASKTVIQTNLFHYYFTLEAMS